MKVLRVIAGALLAFSILFTALLGAKKIPEKSLDIKTPEYKGVLSLWQIDSFASGKGSVKRFLLEVARDFEKSNPGVLVMVTEHSVSGAKESMLSGGVPDIVVFGRATDPAGFTELGVKNAFRGGKVGDKTFAARWAGGGYALISSRGVSAADKKISELVVSGGDTAPLAAFALTGYTAEKITEYKPSAARAEFIKKGGFLVGTQSDVVKLEIYGADFSVEWLTGYNDLYRYVAVTSADENKNYFSQKFVECLLSEKSQLKLDKIAMFSENYRTKAESENFIKLGEVNFDKTISAFLAEDLLAEIKELSVAAATGDAAALKKLKNVLI